MILVDSNVLLDIFAADRDWFSWSQSALTDALLAGSVATNQLVFAEVSIADLQAAELDAVLARLRIQVAGDTYGRSVFPIR